MPPHVSSLALPPGAAAKEAPTQPQRTTSYTPKPTSDSIKKRYLLDLRDPVPDGVEGFLVGDIVNQEDALCASEIRGGDGAEPLLPSRVPDLQLDSLGIAGFV